MEKEENISELTNSKFGSYHWFHTILSQHLHIGEFLKEKSPNEETIKIWGESLYISSKELVKYFNKIDSKDKDLDKLKIEVYDLKQEIERLKNL